MRAVKLLVLAVCCIALCSAQGDNMPQQPTSSAVAAAPAADTTAGDPAGGSDAPAEVLTVATVVEPEDFEIIDEEPMDQELEIQTHGKGGKLSLHKKKEKEREVEVETYVGSTYAGSKPIEAEYPSAHKKPTQDGKPQPTKQPADSNPGSQEKPPSGGEDSSGDKPFPVDKSSSGNKSNSGGSGGGKSSKRVKSHKVQASCPQWGPKAEGQGVTAEDRPDTDGNVFSELSVDEYNAVLNFLYSKKKLALDDLTAPSDENTTLTVANYVHAIYMEIPPKHEVLAYLDEEGPMPARKARAVLVMGKADPPVVEEVLVTLKDEGDEILVSHLKHVDIESSHVRTVRYPQRPQGPLDENGATVALAEVEDKLNEFLSAAFDGFTYGDECDDKCIEFELTFSQAFHKDVLRGSYLQFYWVAERATGNYLHPIPLQALVTSSDEQLEDWTISRLWFNGKWFNSVDGLLEAWKHDTNGIASNFEFIFPEGDEGLYAGFQKRPGPKRGADQPVGPVAWEPYGRRFTISEGNHVSYLGWDFYVGYLPHSGARFWDINFKDERVAYELSLQEAMAMYGAADLTQTNTVFLDSSFGMGYNLREMAQGIDCPMTAAFMDTDIFYSGMSGPTTYKNAICVFEHNPDMPALRHYSSDFEFYGAVPGAQLIVRMISVVYNYDYIQDLILSIDGSIEVRVVTSGYIQATQFRKFYPHHYGYPVFYNVSGTVHTHVLAWKADLDIAGVQNSVDMHCFTTDTAPDGLGGEIVINKYDSKLLETEEESGYVAKITEPKMPVVVNEGATNKWGSARGYKVLLSRPLANLAPKDYPRNKGMGFWNWNFVATKRKEDESHSSSIYTQSDMAHPVTCLADYVDGDSIRNKDIVVWVNSGLYHVPMAEDAPVTPSTGQNQLGFSLIPYNWANENPATDMADMVQLDEENINSTVPAVKKVLRKCKPSYTKVPFGETGFAGVSNTDEDVAAEAANAGGEDNNSSSGSGTKKPYGSGADDAKAAAAAAPRAAPGARRSGVRACRTSGKWIGC